MFITLILKAINSYSFSPSTYPNYTQKQAELLSYAITKGYYFSLAIPQNSPITSPLGLTNTCCLLDKRKVYPIPYNLSTIS